jgi:hypothetical protein
MKFMAHRERDLEHLVQMKVNAGELEFVRRYLDRLARRCKDELARIQMARQYVAAWNIPS